MLKETEDHRIGDLEFKVKYSSRRTIAISVLPDSSVIVRVPYITSIKKISRIVTEKYAWIIKHRDNYRKPDHSNLKRSYTTGTSHMFRGKESVLTIEKSSKPFVRFYDSTIALGLENPDNEDIVKRLLYYGYKNEAMNHFPILLNKVLKENEIQGFRPSGLVIRTMKRRWGSCSARGLITLSTELIKLSDLYIEYVIIHELCHLRHHNHGPHFYELLTEIFPDWKRVRKELRKYIQ
jgi:predicted metal-dependent hydrolase